MVQGVSRGVSSLQTTVEYIWKVVRSKGSLYSMARGKEWQQTKLTIKEPAPEIHEVKATVTVTTQQKPRKPFQERSARGKEKART